MHVLLIKLSSLGDIVHTLPAVEDATRQGVTFDWVVEESFAALPALHRGVREVIPSALRRWRRSIPSSLGEVLSFRRELRKENYELMIDAQGLIKSAVVGRWSRSSVYAGFNRSSASEALAALFYSGPKNVDKTAHAVDRIRSLFAQVLGYEVPTSDPDFGLLARDEPGNDCVLIHGTTWETKLWPEAFWVRIAQRAADFGMTPVLPWYSQAERLRAERISSQVGGSEVVSSMPLASAVGFLARARAILGVDTGLSHLAAALGRPTVVVFGPTDSHLTGSKGVHARNLQGVLSCSPCLSRNCQYSGRPMEWSGSRVEPACFATVHPDRVWDEMTALLT
jgi:heptosyltransferase-1